MIRTRCGSKNGVGTMTTKSDIFSDFEYYLQDKDLSILTLRGYLSDVQQFAGLERLTPHVLRHTFAKNLANKGVGLEKIAALLGHASLNTTRIYITLDARCSVF